MPTGYLYAGKGLLVAGAGATSTDCCCGSGVTCPPPPFLVTAVATVTNPDGSPFIMDGNPLEPQIISFELTLGGAGGLGCLYYQNTSSPPAVVGPAGVSCGSLERIGEQWVIYFVTTATGGSGVIQTNGRGPVNEQPYGGYQDQAGSNGFFSISITDITVSTGL